MKIFFTAVAAVVLFACTTKNKKAELDALNRSAETPAITASQLNNQFIGYQTDSNYQVSGNLSDYKKEEQKQNNHKPSPAKPDWDKKIIKTAELNLEIKNYQNFYKNIREKVTQLGGYVAQETQNQTAYKIENTLVIKIPVDQFDNALTQVSTGVEKINEKKITSEDVTAEVVDTKSRIEAKRQIRLKYLELLKQARNMEEILNVQSEINGVQEEIESAAGRVNYLTHSAAYSTINLTFYEVLNATAIQNDNRGFATRISKAFSRGWAWVGELFVGIISIWPLLILTAFIFIFWKKSRLVKNTKPA